MAEGEGAYKPPEAQNPIEKARQKIVEHLNDVALESPRFQAFSDFADLQEAFAHYPASETQLLKISMIDEIIRQRTNGVKGYKKEYEGLENIVDGLKTESHNRAIRYGRPSDSGDELKRSARFNFAGELQSIKHEEIDKKS